MGPENDLQSVKWSVHLENEGRYVWQSTQYKNKNESKMNRKETIKPCLTVTKREGDTYTEGPLKRKICTLHET